MKEIVSYLAPFNLQNFYVQNCVNEKSVLFESLADSGSYVKEHYVANCALDFRGSNTEFSIQANSAVGEILLDSLSLNNSKGFELSKKRDTIYGKTTNEEKHSLHFLDIIQDSIQFKNELAGAYGYIGYEAGYFAESLKTDSETFAVSIPSKILRQFGNGPIEYYEIEINGVKDKFKPQLLQDRYDVSGEITVDCLDEDYMKHVSEIQKEIVMGRFMQCVLSREKRIKLARHPFYCYQDLGLINPSPYMFYINSGDFQLVGASPELHIRVDNNSVQMRPLAGTIARTKNAYCDFEKEVKLQLDEKETSEHAMLVDLAKNDMHRFCSADSVKVKDFSVIERYPNLFHKASHIIGKLDRTKFSSLDALLQTIPNGTLIGAPKHEAMLCVKQREHSPRGYYGGVIGRIGFLGDCNTGIAIRSALIKNGYAHVRAGAGIVADSNPESELAEVEKKSEKTLQVFGGEK